MTDSLTRPTSPRSALRHLARWLAVVALAALTVGSAFAQSQDPSHESTVVVGKEYSFTGPGQLTPGWHSITFKNEGKEVHQLQFALLNEGVTADQFFASLKTDGDSALRFVTLTGGVAETAPGTSAVTMVDFTKPGTYVELCFVATPKGVPHFALGMTGVVQVSGTPSTVTPPAADVDVHMFDFGYSLPSTITAGSHVWKITNDGPQAHEMNVMKLDDGVTFDDVKQKLEAGPAEEAAIPGTLLGGAQGLQKGLSSYIDFDLAPGTYVLYCNIPDPATGKPHVSLGMLASFTVTPAGG